MTLTAKRRYDVKRRAEAVRDCLCVACVKVKVRKFKMCGKCRLRTRNRVRKLSIERWSK